jgi:hypothetical protein
VGWATLSFLIVLYIAGYCFCGKSAVGLCLFAPLWLMMASHQNDCGWICGCSFTHFRWLTGDISCFYISLLLHMLYRPGVPQFYEHHRNFICRRQHSDATQTWYFPNLISNVTAIWRRSNNSQGSYSSATYFLQLQIFEKKKFRNAWICVCVHK